MTKRTSLSLLVLLLPLALFAQPEKNKESKPDVWQPLRFFEGSWEGTSRGEPGEGKVERDYRFVMNGQFLEVRNKSTYAPQEKNPKGEVHEDQGFISYDRQRKRFVLRQFHTEGFVNQYVQAGLSADEETLVFETESIENIPPGWRARETYRRNGDNEINEVFELAAPEGEFTVYSECTLRRMEAGGK